MARFSIEQIQQAKDRLVQVKAGKHKESDADLEDLRFIATGEKYSVSPRGSDRSNYSFFHLRPINCDVRYNGISLLNGIFTHKDYADYYCFTHAGTNYILPTGESIYGSLHYIDYEPIKLSIDVKSIELETFHLFYCGVINQSLTSSQL